MSIVQTNPVKMKVEMKTLMISESSRTQILETLKYLHGEDFAHKDKSSYKDKGSRLDRKYWVDSGNLIIQGGIDYSSKGRKVLLPHEQINMFALSKLKRYGFHRSHCREALKITSGDVGSAFELLMSRYFDIPLPDPENVPPDILEERVQELDSLKSIYDNCCEEKIANQLWVFHLDLPYLQDFHSGKIDQKPDTGPDVENKNKKPEKDLCKFFSKGYCRFGEKCRFSHIVPVKEVPSHTVLVDKDRDKFELEVRFSPGCRYPREPPLVALTAVSNEFPPELCLKVTKQLFDEAKASSQFEQPCVFVLMDLLLNRQEEVVQNLKKKFFFYDPTMSLFPPKEDISNSKENIGDAIEQRFSDSPRISRHDIDPEQLKRQNDELCKKFFDKQKSPRYKTVLANRKKLPAWNKRETILEELKKHQVLVISGETGCGKSTQVPQFLLDDWLSNRQKEHAEIICTQPRRISAIGVAERVASERLERIAESVGYQIRLETKTSSYTRLYFCTTGILLRRLESDALLNSVTHIIVDEVHERSEESDFLLMILKDLLPLRPDLKVILMSATLNADLFSSYFSNPPIIEIPGRTFPVTQFFLEDILDSTNYVLEEGTQFARKLGKKEGLGQIDTLEISLKIADMESAEVIPNPKTKDENLTVQQLFYRYKGYTVQTCKNIYLMDNERINNELIENILTWIVEGNHNFPKTGSILVFLPGFAEIMALHEQLVDHPIFSPKYGSFLLVPLHSSLSSEEQNLVFKKTPPGVRKIVLSTNIAETSITIDDCVFVIDSGRMKEKRFDSNRNMESLETVWVSKANALQRKGRAGRVMPGVCIHLFTRHVYEFTCIAQPVPEIHRVPLEALILKIKILPNFTGKDIFTVLSKTIEPPSKENISGAIKRLCNLGALSEACELTALGHHLASLPVDVRIGKLIIFGTMFCCVDSALTIAACLSYKSPFVSPFEKKEEASNKKKEFVTAFSDHLTVLKAYRSWMKACSQGKMAGHNFAMENFLSSRVLASLADIKTQFLELLIDIGFVPKIIRVPKKKTGVDRILDITGPELNVNGENQRLLSAILCTALYPNIVKVLTPEKQYTQSISGAVPMIQKAEELKFETKNEKVAIHPSSVNYNINSFPSPYLVYQEKVKTSRVFIRDCTLVPVLPLVLFSSGVIKVELHCGQFVISMDDGWIIFTVQSNEVAELLESMKQEFLVLLDEKIRDPTINLQTHPKGKRIISTIVHLVTHG